MLKLLLVQQLTRRQSSRDAGHVAPSTILVRAHGALTFLTEDGGSDERSSQALFDQEDRV